MSEESKLPTRAGEEMIIGDADVNLCLGSGELLRCPFCGHWAMSHGERTPNGRAICWKISCTRISGKQKCTANVWWTDPDQDKARAGAVAMWNRRPEPEPEAEVKP